MTFHARQALVKVPGESDVPLNTEIKLLVSPRNNSIIFISAPDTAISRIYLAPCHFQAISSTECNLTHQISIENSVKHDFQSVSIVTIKSS